MAYIPYDETGNEFARNQAAAKLFTLIENGLFLFMLIFFSGAIIGLLFVDPSRPDVEQPLARLAWFPVYGIVIILGLASFYRTIRMSIFSPIIILCVLWCGVTFLWSVAPDITIRRTFALLMTTLAGIVLAARYDWCEMVQRLAFVFVALAVMMLLVSVALPGKGIMQEIHPGAWRGPWAEKNYAGGYMTKGLILCMCAFAMRPDRGWLWLPGGLLCFGLVLMSTSKTALLISLAAIGLFITLRITRRYPILRIPFLYGVIISIGTFVMLMATIPGKMFALIGKDPTFTGRTDIWDALIRSISESPILGYGYGAYWADDNGPSFWVQQSLEWGVPSAHNGWIEIWLAGGVIVLALFALHVMGYFILLMDRLKRGGVEIYWLCLCLLMFVGFSLSESAILQQNDLTWVMFVATSAKLFSLEAPYWRGRPKLPYNHPVRQRNG